MADQTTNNGPGLPRFSRGYLNQLQHTLPAGVELYLFDEQGQVQVVSRGLVRRLDPSQSDADRQAFHRFIDDGQFTRYFIGDASTSDHHPTNATFKLGVVRPHSAFTPHAHGAEHFVLSQGYASCGLYDESAGQVVHVRLFPGALLHIPAMMPHSFNNRASAPLLLFVANTGMGVDHEDYAITATQAEQRAHAGREPALVTPAGEPLHQWPHPAETEIANYHRLAAALRQLERDMPLAATHQTMTWGERIAAGLRKLAGKLEVR